MWLMKVSLQERTLQQISDDKFGMYGGPEVGFNFLGTTCQIPVSLPLSKLVVVGKDIQSPKTRFNISRDRRLPDGD